MTEEEWKRSEDPRAMLNHLGASQNVSERKLRLFGVACCRRVAHLLIDSRTEVAIVRTEAFADGLIGEGQLRAANSDAYDAWAELPVDIGPEREPDEPERWQPNMGLARMSVANAAQVLSAGGGGLGMASYVLKEVTDAIWYSSAENQRADYANENRFLSTLLRDIFENPFRPVAVEPGWLTSTVVELARGIYEERAFDRLPILADALQDAGCDDADILGHCRGSGPHVRGCWVVDLALGKG
jgi:hypothetical protein